MNDSEWPRPMETCGSFRKDALKQLENSRSRSFENEEAPIWMEMSNSHKALGHLEHTKTRQVHRLES